MEMEPKLPIPISAIDGRYLLFDIDAITWLRKHHQICGVFIGSLPQNPSQNVFLGLPMQIMSEEAQLLIDLGIVYILDDVRAHDKALAKSNRQRQREYLEDLQQQAREISEVVAKEKEADKERSIKLRQGKKKKQRESVATPSATTSTIDSALSPPEEDTSTSLFATADDVAEPKISNSSSTQQPSKVQHTITPATSALLIDPSPPSTSPLTPSRTNFLPNLNSSSYSFYRHLHMQRSSQHTSAPISARYFSTPGLRFGCQFCVYPGDPLRFHSHFLGVGVEWEEEIDLMDIVGGGRLGTGVKKGWLIGGPEPDVDEKLGTPKLEGVGKVRTFSVEWAGM